MLLYQLSTVWAINSQYAHGFLVPFLLIFLILKIEPQEVENKKFLPFQEDSSYLSFRHTSFTLNNSNMDY